MPVDTFEEQYDQQVARGLDPVAMGPTLAAAIDAIKTQQNVQQMEQNVQQMVEKARQEGNIVDYPSGPMYEDNRKLVKRAIQNILQKGLNNKIRKEVAPFKKNPCMFCGATGAASKDNAHYGISIKTILDYLMKIYYDQPIERGEREATLSFMCKEAHRLQILNKAQIIVCCRKCNNKFDSQERSMIIE